VATGPPVSVALFDQALDSPASRVQVAFADGTREPLQVQRWSGPPDVVDLRLLARTGEGPTLDIGCGPGRLTGWLAAQGTPTLGIDIAPAAVRRTRERGAAALQRSVFQRVPAAGRWRHALLADGNVGIGGDVVALLVRAADLLAPAGSVHVELGAPGSRSGRTLARLEPADGVAGPWFPWAHVPVTEVGTTAAAADLQVTELWSAGTRWFAELVTRG